MVKKSEEEIKKLVDLASKILIGIKEASSIESERKSIEDKHKEFERFISDIRGKIAKITQNDSEIQIKAWRSECAGLEKQIDTVRKSIELLTGSGENKGHDIKRQSDPLNPETIKESIRQKIKKDIKVFSGLNLNDNIDELSKDWIDDTRMFFQKDIQNELVKKIEEWKNSVSAFDRLKGDINKLPKTTSDKNLNTNIAKLKSSVEKIGKMISDFNIKEHEDKLNIFKQDNGKSKFEERLLEVKKEILDGLCKDLHAYLMGIKKQGGKVESIDKPFDGKIEHIRISKVNDNKEFGKLSKKLKEYGWFKLEEIREIPLQSEGVNFVLKFSRILGELARKFEGGFKSSKKDYNNLTGNEYDFWNKAVIDWGTMNLNNTFNLCFVKDAAVYVNVRQLCSAMLDNNKGKLSIKKGAIEAYKQLVLINNAN